MVDPLRLLELEADAAEAEAKAKQKMAASQPKTAADDPSQSNDYLGNLAGEIHHLPVMGYNVPIPQIALDAGKAVKDAGRNIWNLGKQVVQNSADTNSISLGVVKTLYNGAPQTVEGIARRTAEIPASLIPGGRANVDALIDTAEGNPPTLGQLGANVRQDVAQFAGPAVAAQALMPLAFAKKIGTNVARGITGESEAQRLGALSQNPYALAATTGVGSQGAGTAAELVQMEELENATKAFARNKIGTGINTGNQPGPIHPDPLGALKGQFEGMVQKGGQTADAIRAQVAAIEKTNPAGGIDWSAASADKVTPRGPYGLNDLTNSYGQLAQDAIDFGRKPYERVVPGEVVNPTGGEGGQPLVGEATTVPDQQLSLADAQRELRRLDGEIETNAGWNNSHKGAAITNPSALDGYVRTLKFMRNQLKEAIGGQIDTIGSPELGQQFRDANTDISVGLDAGNQVTRSQKIQATALAPRGTNSLVPPPGAGVKEGLMETVAPDAANARKQTAAIQGGYDQVRNLQELLAYQTGEMQTPIPRNYTVAAQMSRDSQKLGQLAYQSSIASNISQMTAMGVPAPQATVIAQQQAPMMPPDITKLPVKAGEKVTADLVQKFPNAFEPPPEGYISYANGKLNDPSDQEMHMQAAMDLPPEQRAKIISNLWKGGLYTPIDATPASAQQPQMTPDEALKRLTQSDTPPQATTDASQGEGSYVLSQLSQAQSDHAAGQVVH